MKRETPRRQTRGKEVRVRILHPKDYLKISELRNREMRWPTGIESPLYEPGTDLRDQFDNENSFYLAIELEDVGIVSALRVTIDGPGIDNHGPIFAWSQGKFLANLPCFVWSRAATDNKYRGKGFYSYLVALMLRLAEVAEYPLAAAAFVAEDFPLISRLEDRLGFEDAKIGRKRPGGHHAILSDTGHNGKAWTRLLIAPADSRRAQLAEEEMRRIEEEKFKPQDWHIVFDENLEVALKISELTSSLRYQLEGALQTYAGVSPKIRHETSATKKRERPVFHQIPVEAPRAAVLSSRMLFPQAQQLAGARTA